VGLCWALLGLIVVSKCRGVPELILQTSWSVVMMTVMTVMTMKFSWRNVVVTHVA